MFGFVSAALLSGTLVLAGGTVSAPKFVQQSGNVFHVAVCPALIAPGTARCHAHVVTDSKGNPIFRAAKINQTPSGYTPANLRAAYNITATGSSSTIVAIVDAYGYTNAASDLATYRSAYGLPACTTSNGCFAKYNESGVQGSYPVQNTGWAQESALDIEMVSAMCPNCKIILVEANSSSYGDLATAENTAAALGARVIDNSYGGSEQGTQPYESAYNHAGIAVTVSTGDDGYAAGPQFPATSPHVTAVGGTSLSPSGTTRGWSETAWSDGGSGCSAIYAKPAWQKDKLCAKRMEADVSAVADPNTGVAVYGPVSSSASGWEVFGGTSVSAQIIGGIYGANGGSGGLVFDGSNPYNNTGSLYDIVSGSNGRCNGSYYCTAGPGYDGPTGLGTPNGIQAF
jgi:subtilase family serine protease